MKYLNIDLSSLLQHEDECYQLAAIAISNTKTL